MNNFTIIPGDDFIWNYTELLQFLVQNQEQSISISTKEEGCCLTSIGLYKTLDLFNFKTVEIRTANIVEHHEKYKILVIPQAFKFFNTSTDYTKYHQWNKKYIFGALYNRAIWHRIGIAGYLKSCHDGISLINFRSDPKIEDQRSLFEIQKLFDCDPDSLSHFVNVMDQFPTQLESIDGYTVGATTTQHTDQLKEFYQDFLIDIVAETFTSGRSFFPTEKTVRPMLLKKPFIAMGPKCFLIHLRQMGFKTFHDFWSEDYDGFGDKDRYTEIIKLINTLSKKSLSELQEMYSAMSAILDHNYNLLKTQSYNKQIVYVE
jgi:hypothetical protein